MVNESEISYWLSVESERIQSLAGWKYQRKFSAWLEGGSEGLDCEQDRITLLASNL